MTADAAQRRTLRQLSPTLVKAAMPITRGVIGTAEITVDPEVGHHTLQSETAVETIVTRRHPTEVLYLEKRHRASVIETHREITEANTDRQTRQEYGSN
jgi:hypothetical protein